MHALSQPTLTGSANAAARHFCRKKLRCGPAARAPWPPSVSVQRRWEALCRKHGSSMDFCPKMMDPRHRHYQRAQPALPPMRRAPCVSHYSHPLIINLSSARSQHHCFVKYLTHIHSVRIIVLSSPCLAIRVPQ